MDIWFYFDVTHRLHTWCNPTSEGQLRELEDVLDLQSGTRVLDVACGLGEMLVGAAERRGIRGVGIDISPYAIRRAETRKAERAPDADVAFLEVRGEEYRIEDGERFDVAMCIGASWIWNGFAGTLDALMNFVRPGGIVVSGEPFWSKEPPPEYCEAESLTADMFTTLSGTLEIARDKGLELVWMQCSSKEDWDRYEMLQTASFDRFAREQPDHPDLEEIRAKLLPSKDAYLEWGRNCLGFAIWVFRVPA
jgi:SAM-dependent methyltransferase